MSGLGEVVVSGQTLASLFGEICLSNGDIDGLLFGNAHITQRTVLNDSDGPRLRPR